MIQNESILNVADNSGAKTLMCIRILKSSHRRYAGIGDTFIGVVKTAQPNMPVKKSEKVLAVVVRRSKQMNRGRRIFTVRNTPEFVGRFGVKTATKLKK